MEELKAVTPTVLKEKLFEIAAKYDSSVV